MLGDMTDSIEVLVECCEIRSRQCEVSEVGKVGDMCSVDVGLDCFRSALELAQDD